MLDRRAFVLGSAAALTGAAGPSLAAAARSRGGPPIRGQVLRRGEPGFAAAAHLYNERFDGVLPEWVARPLDGADVAAAVRWAVASGVPLRARSGGHSYAGYSTLERGLVLDLRAAVNHVTVNRAGTATVGAGAQLLDVSTALAAHGAALPAGSCPSVGVAGMTLGGGMGLLGRAYGLTCDHLVGARIVTADGRLRTVDRDLLWALRGGGGGNFGVVTEFTFRVRALPAAASYFFASWPWSLAAEALETWIGWAPHTDDRLTSIFHLTAGPRGPAVSANGQFLGPQSTLETLVGVLRASGATVVTGTEAYGPLQLLWAGCAHSTVAACHTVGASPGGTLQRASFNAKSDYIARPLGAAGAEAYVASAAARAGQPGSGAILFDSYGGAINRVGPHDAAFVHRGMLAAVQYLSYGPDGGWLERTWRRVRPYVSGEAYQNYIDAAQPDWHHAYYAGNWPRLVATRREVDPHHVFRFPQAVG